MRRGLTVLFGSTLLFAAPALARAASPDRTEVRAAVERAWQAHTAERVTAANRGYPDDPLALSASVGRIRLSKRRISFEGLWKWTSHPVADGSARAFVLRSELEGGGPAAVHLGGRSLRKIILAIKKSGEGTDPGGVVRVLSNPEDMTTYARWRHRVDPLSRTRLAAAVTGWARPQRHGAWWLALRGLEGSPAAWGVPRPMAKVIRAVYRANGNTRRDWLLVAVKRVEHPEEIRAVVEFVARHGDPLLDPALGLESLRFLAGELIAPLQKQVWLKALDEIEAARPAPFAPSQQIPSFVPRTAKRIVADLKRQARGGDWTDLAVERLGERVEIQRIVAHLATLEDAAGRLERVRSLVEGYLSPERQQPWKDALAALAAAD